MAGEELFAPPMLPPDNEGYAYTGDPFGSWLQNESSYLWGRKAHAQRNGNPVPGTSGADLDVERYRQMGAARTSAPWIDRRQSDQARASQYHGLGYQQAGIEGARDAMAVARTAALGQAPSAAEIYGQRMIDDSIASQMAMAASARGGPSAITGAQRQAAFQGAQMQQAGARDLAALRADEMARARDQYIASTANLGQQAGAYTAAAGGIRGQDIGLATSQAQLQADQMARDMANQQFYEELGWRTRKQEQDAQIQRARDVAEAEARRRDLKLRTEDQEWGRVKDAAGLGGGLFGFLGGIFSDIRAKEAYAPISSDARAKYPYSDERAKVDVVPLYEPPGMQLHQSPEGRAFLVVEPAPDDGRASLAGPSRPAHLRERPGRSAEPKSKRAKPREMTYEELLRAAAELDRQMRSEHEARMAAGPAVSPNNDPMSAANRAQAGSLYTYRPEFAAAAGQAPGEPNVGPMAQTMVQDPIAATAVTRDPQTGLLALDRDKLQKLQSAGIAHLQRQIDELKSQIYTPGRF